MLNYGKNGASGVLTDRPRGADSVSNPWFRLYSEFAIDAKMQMMSEAFQRRYIMLLCLRCSNGDVTLQDDEVAFQLRISNDDWMATKAVFVDKNLITEDGRIVAWDKRQYISDSSAERVARHRERKKQGCNVTETPPDTDTDTDISTTNVVDKSVRSEVAQVFEHWKSVMDSPKSNLDKKRKTAIEARLKDGFSVEDLKAAINGCRKTPHNMGDNDRGQKFNDIELICRNAPNVERFMNATGASPPKPKAERPLTAAEKYAAQRDAMRANHERTITGTATRIA